MPFCAIDSLTTAALVIPGLKAGAVRVETDDVPVYCCCV